MPDHAEIAGTADDAGPAAMSNGSAIVAPVTRDHRFQHYAPDRFSILRTASASGERFEIRLQTLVHRDTSQRLAIIPGKEIVTIGRDIRVEVHELAVIDLAWPHLVSLRDELTRAIAAAVPVAPDKAAERLAQLTAQIAVSESQLSHLAWQAPAVAATPSELAQLSDRIGMLVDRLEPSAIAGLRAPQRSDEEAVDAARGRWTAYWGGALFAGVIGLLAWAMAGDSLRAWSRLPPTTTEHSSIALPSRDGDTLSSVQASPAPSPVRAGDAAPSMMAPAAPSLQEAPVRLPPAEPPDAAVASGSDSQATETSLEAATPPTTAPPAQEPTDQSVAKAESATLDAVDNTSAASKAAAAHVAIHVTAKTWLRVRDGAGRVYIARLLQAGETWPAPAVGGLVMTSGNGGSTFVVVDGVSRPAIGSEGVVRTEKLP